MSTAVASRLTPRDVLRVGAVGLRARRLRASLSALGICIGIAAIVSVMGISRSSETQLLNRISAMDNLLVVTPGQSVGTGQNALAPTAPGMIGVVGPVTRVSAVGDLSDLTVRRSAAIPAYMTKGIAVQAADTRLPGTLGVRVLSGTFLTPATSNFPAVVLGYAAARNLGIPSAAGRPQVYLDGQYFTVIGILGHADLVSSIDTSAFVGIPVAKRLLGYTDHPTSIYVRTDPAQVEDVRAVLARTADPQSPQNVQVTRPTDTLAAQAAAKSSFNSLFVGLGAVALLVGGVGIGNVMVISVLERRTEIGLRRALGATRRHIGLQFLTEALALSAIGGVAGTIVGLLVTVGYAGIRHSGLGMPSYGYYGGIVAALVIGGLAGLYPAVRAARLSPTEALRST